MFLISKILKPIAFISPILRVTLQLLLKTLLIQLLQPWPEQNIIVIITTSDSPIYWALTAGPGTMPTSSPGLSDLPLRVTLRGRQRHLHFHSCSAEAKYLDPGTSTLRPCSRCLTSARCWILHYFPGTPWLQCLGTADNSPTSISPSHGKSLLLQYLVQG